MVAATGGVAIAVAVVWIALTGIGIGVVIRVVVDILAREDVTGLLIVDCTIQRMEQ